MTFGRVLLVVINKYFTTMLKNLTLILVVCFSACRPSAPEAIPLPTSVRVQIRHHDEPMRYLPVYFQYNATEFPTYDDPETWMDTFLITDIYGRIELNAVPEGKHWLVATGHDSVPLPHWVYGSLPFEINLTTKPTLDTVVYVTE